MLDKQLINWKGKIFVNELYSCTEGSSLFPLTQVQAVTFNPEGKIVLYKHRDGYYGLPGGKVQENENADEALIREIKEEINADVVNFSIFAFVKSYKKNDPKNPTYNLRYWAIVDANKDGFVTDPAGKALERIIVDVKDAPKILNWGKTGEILVKEAYKEFLKFKNK